jgi:hypothetical protein
MLNIYMVNILHIKWDMSKLLLTLKQIDFTIAYRHGGTKAGFGVAPDMIQIHVLPHLSPEYEFHVNVKRYAMEDLPSEEKELTHWLRQRFIEKDAFLDKIKENWVDGLGEEIWTEDW